MTPIILPGLKLSKKMQELGPELNKLKAQFKGNQAGLVAAQSDLYKKHGVNPASGCLPQVLQIFILIALFSAFNTLLTSKQDLVKILNKHLYPSNQLAQNFKLNSHFLGLDLIKPNTFKLSGFPFPLPGALLIITGLVQLLSSKMMAPVLTAEQKIAEKTSSDTDDAMVAAQQQMLYMFPLMTIVFGYQFSTGLVIYWLVFSVISMVQQYLATGWGGLAPWLMRLNLLKSAPSK